MGALSNCMLDWSDLSMIMVFKMSFSIKDSILTLTLLVGAFLSNRPIVKYSRYRS